MFTKLNKIHQTPCSNAVKKFLPSFEFKKKKGNWGINREKKLEIMKVNKYLKHKINSQNSFYNIIKLNKDYEQAQSFKKYICEFPSINFNRNKNYTPTCSSNRNDNCKKYNTSIITSTSFLKEVKFKNIDVRSRKIIKFENQKNFNN